MSETRNIAREIERKALELGFSACGFSSAQPLHDLAKDYSHWLSSGRAGEMDYLARNIDVRLDPQRLVDRAGTMISLAAAYYSPQHVHTPGNPRISRYAWGEDYHRVLKSRGWELLRWIQQETGPVNGRVFTDSAPVFEREWARRAGIGWIGKNGCLIIPRQGSWFFLAEIIIDIEIKSERETVPDRCGTCTRCIDACPTSALAGDGSMDPRKCISYLTIEHKGAIPDEFRGKWKDWIFGCDICQDVCPWNHKPLVSPIAEFYPRPGLPGADREFFKNLDEGTFRQVFDRTPVMRSGWSGILRNFEFLEK